MRRQQAKIYLSEDVRGRLRQESDRTTHSMSTIVNLLVMRYLPAVVDEKPSAARPHEPAPNSEQEQEQEQETSYEDVDFDF